MSFFRSDELLNVGDLAPDFIATLTTGETISLNDYRGKKIVVLFFYPKDFTSGCTKQVCSFRDNYDQLLKYDVQLLGVSGDSENSHQEFVRRHNLPFPLISDRDKSIARAYRTSNRFMGLLPGSKRVTYVIDKKGRIRGRVHHEVFIGKHIQEVLDAVKMLP
ncbi:MAG: peroxiredoxin [bacterium]